MALPKRIWIHPDDSLQLYITNAIDGAAPYIREPEPCVWRPVQPKDLPEVTVWIPGCENTGMAEPSYGWCPFCGGRIVIEEGKG